MRSRNQWIVMVLVSLPISGCGFLDGLLAGVGSTNGNKSLLDVEEVYLLDQFPGQGGCYYQQYTGSGFGQSLIESSVDCLKACNSYNTQIGGGPALCQFQPLADSAPTTIRIYQDAAKCFSGLSMEVYEPDLVLDASLTFEAEVHRAFSGLLQWSAINGCDISAHIEGATDSAQGHFVEMEVQSLSQDRSIGLRVATVKVQFARQRATQDPRVGQALDIFGSAAPQIRQDCANQYSGAGAEAGQCVGDYFQIYPFLPTSHADGGSVRQRLSADVSELILKHQVSLLLDLVEADGSARKVQAHLMGDYGGSSFLLAL